MVICLNKRRRVGRANSGLRSLIVSVFFAFLVSLASYEVVRAQDTLSAEEQQKVAAEVQKQQRDQKENEFAGLTFGVGISTTFDVGNHDRVKDAQVVDGIVRISSSENARARVMLESHYFFLRENCRLVESRMCGWGPFIALQPGTDNIIEAAAIGLMVGYRRNRDESASFNLGVGLAVDVNVKTLGDGIFANQPLPAGETEVRFRTREQLGVVILASFSF